MKVLASVLMTFFVSMDISLAADEVCNSSFQPSKVLTPLSCDSTSEIIILAEEHFDPIAVALKSIASDLGSQKEIYSFTEGSVYKDVNLYGNSYGLEDDLVNGISSLQAGQNILELFSKIPAKNDDEKRAVSLSVSAFVQGFFQLQSLWGDLSWIPENSVGPENSLCLKNIISFKKTLNSEYLQDAMQFTKQTCANFESSMNENLFFWEVGMKILEKAKLKIEQDPKYTYLAGADFNTLLGSGRDLIFAKNILKNYCDASKSKKNIWVQVGRGHSDGLSCYLKAYLPSKVKITVKQPEDYKSTLDNWPMTFSLTAEKVKQIVISKNNGANVRATTSTDNSYLDFLLNKVSAADLSEVKKIIVQDGFHIINWRSTPGNEDIPAHLGITFDPFNVK